MEMHQVRNIFLILGFVLFENTKIPSERTIMLVVKGRMEYGLKYIVLSKP